MQDTPASLVAAPEHIAEDCDDILSSVAVQISCEKPLRHGRGGKGIRSGSYPWPDIVPPNEQAEPAEIGDDVGSASTELVSINNDGEPANNGRARLNGTEHCDGWVLAGARLTPSRLATGRFKCTRCRSKQTEARWQFPSRGRLPIAGLAKHAHPLCRHARPFCQELFKLVGRLPRLGILRGFVWRFRGFGTLRTARLNIGHLLDMDPEISAKLLIFWRSLGESNPCFRRERGASARFADIGKQA